MRSRQSGLVTTTQPPNPEQTLTYLGNLLKITKPSFGFWLLVWAAVIVLQAMLTPIHEDEAYYWMYSRQLDWGYFDHPPMTGLFIWISDKFFGWTGTMLGVRAVTIAAHLMALWLLWRTLYARNGLILEVFWLFVAMLPLLHFYSFVTTPDAPLLLFTALFFFQYKKVVEQERTLDYVLLGMVMALMLYSKYHGLLVIFFTILSNPRLMLRPKSWLAVTVGVICFLPHLWWQYQHDWVSFRFHLGERVGESLWYHRLEFFGNLLLILNPFLVATVFRMRHIRPKDLVERALVVLLLGTLLFFFIQTYRDHVQPQWLFAVYLPFLMLNAVRMEEKQVKKLRLVFWISLPLLLFVRTALVVDLVRDPLGFHRKKSWASAVHAASGGLPVLIHGSYQRASLYGFYQNAPFTHSLSPATSRRNQFGIWQNDAHLHGKKVFYVGDPSIPLPMKEYPGFYGGAQDFLCYEHLRIQSVTARSSVDSLWVSLELENPYPFAIDLGTKGYGLALLGYEEGKLVPSRLCDWSFLGASPLQSGEKRRFDAVFSYKKAEQKHINGLGLGVFRGKWPAATGQRF